MVEKSYTESQRTDQTLWNFFQSLTLWDTGSRGPENPASPYLPLPTLQLSPTIQINRSSNCHIQTAINQIPWIWPHHRQRLKRTTGSRYARYRPAIQKHSANRTLSGTMESLPNYSNTKTWETTWRGAILQAHQPTPRTLKGIWETTHNEDPTNSIGKASRTWSPVWISENNRPPLNKFTA
jgi:hypothetical protein